MGYNYYDERKVKAREIFADTEAFYRSNKVLVEAINATKANTKVYDNDFSTDVSGIEKRYSRTEVTVSNARSFEAAIRLTKENDGKKVAVLNFASASNPGGGVVNGATAQEESLCRASTLYPCLNTSYNWDNFYSVNRAMKNCLHDDKCIYTPGIVICKTDEVEPKRVNESDFVMVDVITCAAPNLRDVPSNTYNTETGEAVSLDYDGQYRIHLQRARHILAVAAANGIDILVLGAFGCGAFRNNPRSVAKAYKDAMLEFDGYFDKVDYAIYYTGRAVENYETFKSVM